MTSRNFFITEAKRSYAIATYLREELKFAGFSHADIKKTPLGTRITIYAIRPGLVIGSGGENIKAMTQVIEKKFGVENLHIEVEQIDDIFLDPHIVAWRIAKSLEKGGNFKRITTIMVQRIIAAGARGVEIRLSGKLPSKRAKTWKFNAGNLRKCGFEVVEYGKVAYEVAIQKLGVIGVRVAIIPPEAKFSDEIHEIVIESSEKEEGKPEKVKEEKVPVKPVEELEKELVNEGAPDAPVELPIPEPEKVKEEKPAKAETKKKPAKPVKDKKPAKAEKDGKKADKPTKTKKAKSE